MLSSPESPGATLGRWLEMNVGSAPILKDRQSARIATVEQHVRLENEHDLEGVLGTFGDTAKYEDELGANITRVGMEFVTSIHNS